MKFYIVSTESDFSTITRTVEASSRQEAMTLAPTTGGYDKIVKLGCKFPPRLPKIGSVIKTETMVEGVWTEV